MFLFVCNITKRGKRVTMHPNARRLGAHLTLGMTIYLDL